MESAMGALGVLLPKLTQLLQDEYNLHKNAKKDIQYVSKELQRIYATLQMVSEMQPENLTKLVKMWVADVRELSYDMEDIVDSFLVRVQGPERPNKKGTKRILKEMTQKLTKAWAYSGIGHEIKDLKERVKEVADRRDRYKIETVVPAKTTSVDPRVTALYTNLTKLVGIDEAREELITRVIAEDDTSTLQQRIISIVGFGGLGKTTLAKAVCEKLKNKFDCTALIPVSRNPDTKKLLKDILYELDKQKYENIHGALLDERQLIDLAREFLQNKRRIFGCGDIFPEQYYEVSEKFLKKCAGVPLAIITTSGLLANKLGNVKEWHQLCDSIGSGIGRNDDMENMRKILSLSYYDLPSHRKTCLLYLSIYPEDYKIDKEELIWKWIAEGFVQHGKGGQSLFEIGESYFHELVNRSLVQPIYSSDHDSSTLHDVDEPWSCHVHDMVLDLISSLSREENFATTVLGDDNGDTYSGNKIHRLALHDTNWPTRDISRLNISKLRSLTIFGSGCIINSMPPSLPCYRLLRVLDLRYSNFVCGHSSLRLFIGNLVHLRYLRLPWDVYTDEVLAEIGKLQYLQWLDLGGAENIRELPSSILGLKKLMLLFINTRIRLPAGLKNLTSLEELRHQVLVDSVQLAEEQGHLTQLRILSLVVSLEMKKDEEGRWDESLRTALVGSLANLHKIQTLDIYNNNYESDLDGSMDSPLGNLRDLIIFSIKLLPSWINPVTLPLLSRLQIIMVSQVRRQDIQVLGMLQALTSLDIRVSGGRPRPRVLERSVVGADAFPCLVECTLLGFPVVPSMFPAGAMPRLETFRFYIDLEAFSTGGDLTVDDDLALGHLPSLQEVAVSKLVTAGDEAVSSQDEVATKVKEKLWHEKDVHPNHPSIYLY
ncbi:hypothetical protein BS78_K197200 [Paspalum vaginatum]|uniref:Uncharacterized protein n=1 Tax=Paspalum vaginatum TaxID=158149 RepID=A0A9W7XDK0_9POAL|nr:hypothetical protein BS78_K197200 [Paspalum vaginatum]